MSTYKVDSELSIEIDDDTGLPVLPEGKVWRFDDVHPYYRNVLLYEWGNYLSGHRVHYGYYKPGATEETEQEVYETRNWWGKKVYKRRDVTRKIDNPEPVFVIDKCDYDADLTEFLYGPPHILREKIAERALAMIIKERREEMERARRLAALKTNKELFVGTYPPRTVKE